MIWLKQKYINLLSAECFIMVWQRMKVAMLYDNNGLSLAAGVIAVVSIVVGASAFAGLSSTNHVVSQKNKLFGPSNITLHLGDYITIVNDDGNFVHQAYVEADNFTFESGDIEPGASSVIWFPRDGDFTVLCGIHPKMRLAVRVQGSIEQAPR